MRTRGQGPGPRAVEIDVAGYNCNNFYLPVQTPFLQAEVVVDGRIAAKTAADGAFTASDPALERIFDAARQSYAANAVDGLTDCPIRERAGWLGDTFFTGRASRWMTGSEKNERLFLTNFLLPERFEGPRGDKAFSIDRYEGLVPAVWPVDLMCDDCFIPTFDVWFVLQLEEFATRRGGDGFTYDIRLPDGWRLNGPSAGS